MLALVFFALATEPQDNVNRVSNDWSVAAPVSTIEPKKNEFDPSAALYKPSTMCVIVKGQPEPECAKIAAQTPISLGDDVFANGVGGNDTTCETIESIKRDANGNPQRVFATYCGDDPARADYRSRQTPTSGDIATRPTQRPVGPNQVNSSASN